MNRIAGQAYRAAWLFVVLVSGAQALPPPRVVIEYDMSYNGIAMAQAVARLEHDGKTYVLGEEVKGKGVYALIRSGAARRSARGTISADGLKPAEFRDRRGDAPENIVRFDWSARTLLYGQYAKGESKPMPTPALLSDRLTFLWTFAFRAVEVLRPGREVRAVLSDGKGLSTFRYLVAGPETLKTPAGALETIKLVKQRDPGDDRATEIWLASDRHYLPVRILVVEKDGTRIDQTVTRIGS